MNNACYIKSQKVTCGNNRTGSGFEIDGITVEALVPFVTLDKKMRKVARNLGVTVFAGRRLKTVRQFS